MFTAEPETTVTPETFISCMSATLSPSASSSTADVYQTHGLIPGNRYSVFISTTHAWHDVNESCHCVLTFFNSAFLSAAPNQRKRPDAWRNRASFLMDTIQSSTNDGATLKTPAAACSQRKRTAPYEESDIFNFAQSNFRIVFFFVLFSRWKHKRAVNAKHLRRLASSNEKWNSHKHFKWFTASVVIFLYNIYCSTVKLYDKSLYMLLIFLAVLYYAYDFHMSETHHVSWYNETLLGAC